ncbi:MAG: hypothetical protein U9Q21_03295 [Candidatus Auribacterota bacterium]|nr:hypothetical protein [Candidatus Auribacterota bacterium]
MKVYPVVIAILLFTFVSIAIVFMIIGLDEHQFIAAIVPLFIVILGVYILYLNREMGSSRSNIRIYELHAKRYPVYESLMRLMSNIIIRSSISQDEVDKFYELKSKSTSIFNPEVQEYIGAVCKKANELHKVNSMLFNILTSTEKENLLNHRRDLFEWFTEQVTNKSRAVFEKSLELKN